MIIPALEPAPADTDGGLMTNPPDVPVLDRVPLQLGVKGLKPRMLVGLERFEAPPHDLDVLLRHRLLRQPGGFEGFRAVCVFADAIEPAAAQLASPECPFVNSGSAAFAPAAEAHGDKCTVLCRCDLDLLHLDQERLPGLKPPLQVLGECLRAVIGSVLLEGHVLNLRVKLRGERTPVALVERAKESP